MTGRVLSPFGAMSGPSLSIHLKVPGKIPSVEDGVHMFNHGESEGMRAKIIRPSQVRIG
jgi:hypothetical protein